MIQTLYETFFFQLSVSLCILYCIIIIIIVIMIILTMNDSCIIICVTEIKGMLIFFKFYNNCQNSCSRISSAVVYKSTDNKNVVRYNVSAPSFSMESKANSTCTFFMLLLKKN